MEKDRIEKLLNEAEAEANQHYNHYRDLASGRVRYGDHEAEWDLFTKAEIRVNALREAYHSNKPLSN